MTQKELLKKALILLDEAAECIDEALRDEVPGTHRSFPLPETRDNLRSIRRVRRDLDDNWSLVWRNPS